MRRFIHTAAFLILMAMMAGCTLPSHVYVAVRNPRQALPEGSTFRIVTTAPPKDAVYVGTVTMDADHKNLPEVVNELRRKVQRAGANLVANFRCGARRDYIVTEDTTIHETRRGTYVETSTDVKEITSGFCRGQMYYINPPPAPVSKK